MAADEKEGIMSNQGHGKSGVYNPPRVWTDLKHFPDGSMHWGVECEDKSLAFDGHFICIVPHKDPEAGRIIAEAIVDAITGRRPFRRK